MSMDIDAGAIPCHHSHHDDSAGVNPPNPSGGRISPQAHQAAGSVQSPTYSAAGLPPIGSEPLSCTGSPQLMMPSSPVHHLGRMENINQKLTRQHRGVLCSESPVREVTPRKRKHDSRLTHTTGQDDTQDIDAFTDSANSRFTRRIRPRLWTQQVGGFSPLLYISPDQERDHLLKEAISAFHYPPDVTDPPTSIQRYFHPGNPHAEDPRAPRDGPSPTADDLGDPKERQRRSNSANSLAEVAMARVVPPKHGRLSTLQDFFLPRPFEGAERPSVGMIKDHERGLDTGPSFPATSGCHVGGLPTTRGPTDSAKDTAIGEHDIHVCASRSTDAIAMLSLEPSSAKYFADQPLCDSPDTMNSADQDGLTHFELLATCACFDAAFQGQSRAAPSRG